MSPEPTRPEPAPVWLSSVIQDPDLIKPLTSDLYENDPERLVESFKKWRRAEAFGPEAAPREMYVQYHDLVLKSVPDVFQGSSFLVVSQKVTEVLNRFELGKTRLNDVKIFEHDRATRIGGIFFVVSFGETKETLVAEQTPCAQRIPYTKKTKWYLPPVQKPDEVTVYPSAGGGVDLWLDENVPRAIFMSSALVSALGEAGLNSQLRLSRCKFARVN